MANPGTSSAGTWNSTTSADDYAADYPLAGKKASTTYRTWQASGIRVVVDHIT